MVMERRFGVAIPRLYVAGTIHYNWKQVGSFSNRLRRVD
jgi:hypothetical protein